MQVTYFSGISGWHKGEFNYRKNYSACRKHFIRYEPVTDYYIFIPDLGTQSAFQVHTTKRTDVDNRKRFKHNFWLKTTENGTYSSN